MSLRVPVRFRDATIESLSTKQFDVVIGYSKAISAKVANGDGLLLCGPPGVGKTWAIVALTKVYAALPGGRRDYEFVTAPDMFERYATFSSSYVDGTQDPRREQPWRKTFETVPWLVINDLAKEYHAGKLDEQVTFKLGRILRARSERRLVTHITTNLGVTDLKARYGESITSLLSESIKAIQVTGPDRRKCV